MKTLFRVTIAVVLTLTLATCATAQTATGTTAETWERYPLTTAIEFAAALNTCSKALRTFELGVLQAFPSGKRKTPKLTGAAG